MNTQLLARRLILILIAALVLSGAIHLLVCDQMMRDPALARPYASMAPELCVALFCTLLAISTFVPSAFLIRLADRLPQSAPIMRTVHLPQFSPPPRSA